MKKWHSRVSPFINGDFNYFFHSFYFSNFVFFSLSLHLSCWLFLPVSFSCIIFLLGDVNKTLGSFPLWFIKSVFFFYSRWVKSIKKKRNIHFDTIRFDSAKFGVLFNSHESKLAFFFFVWFRFVCCALKFIWISQQL